MPSAIAGSLGLPDVGPDPPLERVSTYLHGGETLLILDNFEQVLPAAPLLATLLRAAPGLRLLATSRELLHLRAEQTLPVPPFALPDPAHLPPLDQLAQVPSVALFTQRAHMINPGFRLSDANARAEAVGQAHALYFLELAERAAPELVGRTQRAWFLRLEQVHGNLRAGLRWWWNHGENGWQCG